MQGIINGLQSIPIQWYIYLCTALFCIGIAGVLLKRNALIVFMSIEMMLNAANLLLAAFSAYRNDASGQVFVFFIMVVAACEVAIGLALLVMIYRNSHHIDTHKMSNLKW
jgi:NADH-quinone oxidoreductase subunit K